MREALEAARQWSTRPTQMLGMLSLPWSEADRLLAQALTLHDKDICPGGCGHYLDETSTEDGWHEVHTIRCDACAARDDYADEHSKQEHKEPGELTYVTRVDDE